MNNVYGKAKVALFNLFKLIPCIMPTMYMYIFIRSLTFEFQIIFKKKNIFYSFVYYFLYSYDLDSGGYQLKYIVLITLLLPPNKQTNMNLNDGVHVETLDQHCSSLFQ